jgi:hypothetical protein
MGNTLNASGDLLPPDPMYAACRIIGRHVKQLGGTKWDFSRLHTMPIDPQFEKLIKQYLADVLASPALRKGWKIPETTLAMPWIVRLFPDAHYIHWVRDPRDSILKPHQTDDLSDFGIEYDKTDDVRLRRAISWKYQAELVRATPRPKNWLTIRFEDFVLNQDQTLRTLGEYLGFPLVKIATHPDAVGRWKQDRQRHDFDFLLDDLREFGYELPRTRPARRRRAPAGARR